jgi:hypothetical protein
LVAGTLGRKMYAEFCFDYADLCSLWELCLVSVV